MATRARAPGWRRMLLRGGLAAAGLPLLLIAAAAGYVLSLPPPDLSRADDRSTVVLDRDGRLLRPFVTADGRWKLPVTAADVDPRYLAMLKAYEDRRFERHFGVDPLAMLRAAGQMLASGQIVSGGSTLSMQVARLLEPRENRSLASKLRQAARAIDLERRFDKQRILDLYLNLAPFGGNLEGIRAASFAYFGKEPKRLSTAEAALLIALPQSPEQRRPDRFAPAAEAARRRVLERLRLAGLVTGREYAAALDETVPTARRPFPALAPHAAEQAAAAEPERRVHRLTIDSRLQASLEQLARERAAGLGAAVSIAMLAVDNATGEIRASVGGVEYLSAERAGGLDLTQALRSPGSALKPFIYALAFDNGIAHPETVLEDRPARYGLYVPENFDLSFQGTVSARKALQLSLNVPAVQLLQAVGPQRFLTRLRESGAGIALQKDETAPGLAIGLGGLGITLRDLTRLFAGLARGGEVAPLTIRQDDAVEPGRRFVSQVAAWYVSDVLIGAPPPLNAPPGQIAYKTGTSYGYRDAWAIGYDRTHTIGVWVGRADNAAVPGLVGRVVAAPILFDAFARLGRDSRPFAVPANAIIASNASLPPPLRHLRADLPKTASALTTPALRLAFPPDGAQIDLAATMSEGRPFVALKALGGAPPYTWLVDGVPVTQAQPRRESAWTPDGAGFVRISVIDGTGASESVAVRLR